MHQSMRSPRCAEHVGDLAHAVDGVALLVARSAAARRGRDGRGCAATNCSSATTNAATLPFMSAAPRPYSTPSRTSGTNGSLDQASRARRHHVGMAEQHQRPDAPLPCVAHRLSTSPKRRCSQAKPQRSRRRQRWQPASSGVTERADQLAGQFEHVAHGAPAAAGASASAWRKVAAIAGSHPLLAARPQHGRARRSAAC